MSPKAHVEEEQSGFDPEERGQGPGSFDGQRMQDSGEAADRSTGGCEWMLVMLNLRGSRSRRCLDSVTDLGLWEQGDAVLGQVSEKQSLRQGFL